MEKSKLDYFIDRTDDRLEAIEKSLSDLHDTKIGIVSQARIISVIVSSICSGIIVLLGIFFS